MKTEIQMKSEEEKEKEMVRECIAAAHKAHLQNAEQLSMKSIPARFVQLCAWYSQAEKEAATAKRERDSYREREKLCETMDKAEKLALIRALQEIRDAVGLFGDGVSPAQIVEAVRSIAKA